MLVSKKGITMKSKWPWEKNNKRSINGFLDDDCQAQGKIVVCDLSDANGNIVAECLYEEDADFIIKAAKNELKREGK
jgi:hypothetical protein